MKSLTRTTKLYIKGTNQIVASFEHAQRRKREKNKNI